MVEQPVADTRFHGQWVGETQGYPMPAHLWSIRQDGRYLYIQTRWDGETEAGPYWGRVQDDGTHFTVAGDFTATLVDPQHFIIPGWCMNNTRGDQGPDYDVVFSRPGLAELTAHAVWQRWRAQQPPAPNDAQPED